MPHAICDNGHVIHWRNVRGTRLADMRCHQCGARFHRAVFVDGQWRRSEKRKRLKCERHGLYYHSPPHAGCRLCRREAMQRRERP